MGGSRAQSVLPTVKVELNYATSQSSLLNQPCLVHQARGRLSLLASSGEHHTSSRMAAHECISLASVARALLLVFALEAVSVEGVGAGDGGMSAALRGAVGEA